ncbi:MAG TPA: hypothetical protein VE074_13925 [Jatrophihabitantaceae bacterium]|nr:hypothetical protein [Jatrophihabitantaceae bacterium]
MSTVPYRLDQVEEHVRQQRELNMKINEGLYALNHSLALGIATLTTRMEAHDKAKDRWRAMVMTVASGVALALILFLAKVTWMMQSAKLP